MRKIYSHATNEQLTLKVKVLKVAVQESIDIANSTTVLQRCKSMLFIPVNRRALSKYFICDLSPLYITMLE